MARFRHKPPLARQATSCEGKHRFTNGQIAHKVAAEQRRRRDTRSEAYRCEFCGGWHVGVSVIPKKQRGIRYGR